MRLNGITSLGCWPTYAGIEEDGGPSVTRRTARKSKGPLSIEVDTSDDEENAVEEVHILAKDLGLGTLDRFDANEDFVNQYLPMARVSVLSHALIATDKVEEFSRALGAIPSNKEDEVIDLLEEFDCERVFVESDALVPNYMAEISQAISVAMQEKLSIERSIKQLENLPVQTKLEIKERLAQMKKEADAGRTEAQSSEVENNGDAPSSAVDDISIEATSRTKEKTKRYRRYFKECLYSFCCFYALLHVYRVYICGRWLILCVVVWGDNLFLTIILDYTT